MKKGRVKIKTLKITLNKTDFFVKIQGFIKDRFTKTPKISPKIAIVTLVAVILIGSLFPILKLIKQSQTSNALTPQIDRIYPNIGQPTGGDKVIVQGRNFEPPAGVKHISVGLSRACALADDNNIYCWGDTPELVNRGAIPADATITHFEAGESFCAVDSTNKIYCWGGMDIDSSVPVQVPQGEIPLGVKITELSVSYRRQCVLTEEGKVYCWGAFTNGSSSAPTQVPQGEIPQGVKITQISGKASHSTCALASNNKVYCWGGGAGFGGYSASPTQVPQGQVPASETIIQVFASGADGSGHFCLLTSSGKAYCWGGTSSPVEVAQGEVPSGVSFKQLSIGYDTVCALATNQKMYCWGSRSQIPGANNDSNVPIEASTGQIPEGEYITQVSFTGEFWPTVGCALASNKKVYCWGQALGPSGLGINFGDGIAIPELPASCVNSIFTSQECLDWLQDNHNILTGKTL